MLKGKRVMIYIWSGVGVASRQRDSCNPSDVVRLHADILFAQLHWPESVSALNTSCSLGHQLTDGGCSSVSSRDTSWHLQCCSQTESSFSLHEAHGRWEVLRQRSLKICVSFSGP